MPRQDQDEIIVQGGEDDGLATRIKKAIKRSLFGGGDVNLPDENPNRGTPADSAREREHAARRHTQTMEKLKDFGNRMNDATRAEKIKALRRKGMSEEEATRKALGNE